ncbi:MAG: YraN family protein [Roseimicrobium sp.]
MMSALLSLAGWQRGLRDILSRPSLRTRMRLKKSDGARIDNATLGNWGEHLAAQWLRRNGRKVLYRNFRAGGGGEVDIVARHGKMLTFVEVKTRTSTARGRPAEAVNKAKEELIIRGMQGWLRMLDDSQNIPRRCDIVEVVLHEGERPVITILEGALKE